MTIRSVAIIILLAFVGGFVALNWAVVSAPGNLNLGFFRVEAPMGLTLLMIAGFLVVVFMLMLARVELGALTEARRATREIDEARKLADSAEASRVRELRDLVASEIGLLRADIAQLRSELSRVVSAPAPRP
ncbi:MAG: DNA cytosine methyltransferase [Betaproteobacteria bacterium]